MSKKKYEYDESLPPRSDPNYMKLYREKHKNRLKKLAKNWIEKKVEENPNYWKEKYDPKRAEKYRKENRAVLMERQWKKRGIIDLTYERFHEDLKKQNNCCKICGNEMKLPQADHDHKTGKYRAALCMPCNMGVGVYENNKEQFEKYLKDYK